MNCIGLFGTCGTSTWRQAFIATYDQLGIKYFNPQKDDWRPEDADEEAEHLLTDSVILFPVTGETYGTGSLAESGFSIVQAIKPTSDSYRFIVIYIESDLDPTLKADPIAYKESIRARALIKAHLKKLHHPGVYVASSLEEMLSVSIPLYNALLSASLVMVKPT